MDPTYFGGLVQINSRPLFLEVVGPLDGEPFVAMHGLGGSTNTFPIANEIAALGYRVIRWDYEGSGKSPMGTGKEFKMDGLVEDCKAVLEYAVGDRKLEKVHIFGHSGGAAIGQFFAAKYPELVSSLILSCPGLPRPGRPAVQQGSLNQAARARKFGLYALADSAPLRNLGPKATRQMKALYRTTHCEGTIEGYAQILEMLAELPAPDWSKVVCKTLVIATSNDFIVAKEAEEFPALLPNAKTRLRVFDCGHLPAVEVSEEVLDAVTAFLEQ